MHMLELCIYDKVFSYAVFTCQSGIKDLKLIGTLDTTCRCLMGNTYCGFYCFDEIRG